MNFFDTAVDVLTIVFFVGLFALPAAIGRWTQARTYRRAVEAYRREQARNGHGLAA